MNPRTLLVTLALSFSVLSLCSATPDVSGSWKWTFERNGEPLQISMKIKQDGAKLAGTVTGPEGREMEIKSGKIADDGKLAFFLEIDRDGNALKINFEGSVSGDTITGKTKYKNAEGEEREREWVAKREAAKVARDISGEWKSSFKRQDGTSMETTLTLKQNGEKLTGQSSFGNGNDTEIQDGKIQGNDISFKLVRERDGRTVTSKYRGKLQDDRSIKGQIESDWTGEVRRMEWEAKKAQ